jgi:hypothetical protein
MAGRIDKLEERVQAVEEKVDRLSSQVDERFHAVDVAFLEQREYTEFGYARLEANMDAGFGRLERKLDQFIDAQLRRGREPDVQR